MLKAIARERPLRPTAKPMPDSLWQLVEISWSHDFNLRPDMVQIVKKLDGLVNQGAVSPTVHSALCPFLRRTDTANPLSQMQILTLYASGPDDVTPSTPAYFDIIVDQNLNVPEMEIRMVDSDNYMDGPSLLPRTPAYFDIFFDHGMDASEDDLPYPRSQQSNYI